MYAYSFDFVGAMGGRLKRSLGMAPPVHSQAIPKACVLEAATGAGLEAYLSIRMG